MAEVTVRDAAPEDAVAIGEVWAAAMPHLVRSVARASADLHEDPVLSRRRWVGLVDDTVVGTATARVVGVEQVHLTVEVRPDFGSRGVGTSLLTAAAGAFNDTHDLSSVCRDDPISLAFAVRNGFLPEGENRVARVEPSAVRRAGPLPDGLTATTLDRLPDLDALLATYNAAAQDDPSGLSRQYDKDTFRADWWNSPDNTPELSWALVDSAGDGPVVASFTSLQVDRPRGRAWSTMTATHPSYRGRGLALWVKSRALNAAADAGLTEAWTANDATNGPMIAVNDALGYRPAARTIRVRRRLPH